MTRVRAGTLATVTAPAAGPSLSVVFSDEDHLQTWSADVRVTTAKGAFFLGRVTVLPFAAHSNGARRVAVAHVPGAESWSVDVAGASRAAGVYSQTSVELITGDAPEGAALQAVDGVSYLDTGRDVDAAAVAQTGQLLARAGRVLEISAINTGSALAWLQLWRALAQPSPAAPITGQPIPLPPGVLVVRRFSRPLSVVALSWSLSTTPLVLTPSAAEALVFAQVE